MTGCDLCGFVYDDLPAAGIAERIRLCPSRFRHAVSGASSKALGERPEPTVWSALEYVCHVRDVLLIQRDRAVLALVEDCPSYARMYRDERVDLCAYTAQQPQAVLDQLDMAADLCSLVFEGIGPGEWSRSLVYNWPEPATFDLRWLGRHTVHEAEHHLQDVSSVLRGVTGG